MAKIKNMGHATVRFNEGVIISGSAGTDNKALVVTGSMVISGSESKPAMDIYANVSGQYVTIIDNDNGSSGHVLKLSTDGNGSGSRILEMEDGDGDVVFRARADGRFGFGPDGVSSMGAGTFVVGIDNSSHTSDIAISQRLQHLGDSNTYMEFPSNDNITFAAGGSEELKIASDAILVKQHIKHDGDEDTLINFADNKIVLKAGNIALVTAEKNSSAPHEVTINDGSNNVDFVVKGNGSNQGNPGMKFDADTNKLGINGIGTPAYELEVAGDIGLAEYIYHRGDDDTFIRFEDDEITFNAGGRTFINLQEASTDKMVINNGGLNIDLQVKGENFPNLIRTDAANDSIYFGASSGAGNDNNFWVSGSLNSKGTADRGTAVFSGDLVVSGTLYSERARRVNAEVISSYPHNVTEANYIILSTGTANPVRKILLPSISGQQGRIIIVKDAGGNAGSNGLEIDADGSETIDGSLDKLINTNYGSLTLVCGPSEWHVIGSS